MPDLTPIGDQLLEEYRCQNRDGPDGQRCQLVTLTTRPPGVDFRNVPRMD